LRKADVGAEREILQGEYMEGVGGGSIRSKLDVHP
jgi:hypothetical protein